MARSPGAFDVGGAGGGPEREGGAAFALLRGRRRERGGEGDGGTGLPWHVRPRSAETQELLSAFRAAHRELHASADGLQSEALKELGESFGDDVAENLGDMAVAARTPQSRLQHELEEVSGAAPEPDDGDPRALGARAHEGEGPRRRDGPPGQNGGNAGSGRGGFEARLEGVDRVLAVIARAQLEVGGAFGSDPLTHGAAHCIVHSPARSPRRSRSRRARFGRGRAIRRG